MIHKTISSHEEMFLLLPWFVSQTLDADEQSAVASHVEECTVCQQEVQFLSCVNETVTEQDDVCAIAQNGFARVLQTIEQDEAISLKAGVQTASVWSKIKAITTNWLQSQGFGWQGIAIAAPAVLVLMLAVSLFTPTSQVPQPEYKTLTSDDTSADRPFQFKVQLAEQAESILLQDYFQQVLGTTVIAVEKIPGGGFRFQLPLDADPTKVTSLLKTLKNSAKIKSVELVVD